MATVERLDNFELFDLLSRIGCALLSGETLEVVEANEYFAHTTATSEGSIFAIYPALSQDQLTTALTERGFFDVVVESQSRPGDTIDVHLAFRKLVCQGQERVFVQASDRTRERERDAILERATRLLERRNTQLGRLNRELGEAHDHLLVASKITAVGEIATAMILEMQAPLAAVTLNASLLDEHMRDEESTAMMATCP